MSEPLAVADGCVVAVKFKVRNDAGEVLDDTGDRADPYLHGADNMPPALEAHFEGHIAGDVFEVTLSPEEGYGVRDEEGVQTINTSDLPSDFDVPVGASFLAEDDEGSVIEAHVVKVTKQTITIDTNHPLAGQTLHFNVEITLVRAATKEELEHGHPHGISGHEGHQH